ncbi:MAG: hypothetical protein UHH87_03975, partial [Akkermansia sp.]|nr:hypothetical protein [Akkermansia sp.]
AYNRLETETTARGKVKTHSYESARGLLLGTTYSDSATPRSYAYNHLGQLPQVTLPSQFSGVVSTTTPNPVSSTTTTAIITRWKESG